MASTLSAELSKQGCRFRRSHQPIRNAASHTAPVNNVGPTIRNTGREVHDLTLFRNQRHSIGIFYDQSFPLLFLYFADQCSSISCGAAPTAINGRRLIRRLAGKGARILTA